MAALTFFEGAWQEGNVPLYGSTDHAVWLASTVFDGARAFDGLAPDLDRHCERIVGSARAIGLEPGLDAGEIEAIAWDGIRRFPRESVLYVRPMFWATGGFVVPDAASTRFALVVHDLPFPTAPGFSLCMSPSRRPSPDSAPTDAKASLHYPQAARVLREAAARGFENAVVCDQDGFVAETASSNLWLAKDGVAITPALNGTFLAGITRRRTIALLREDGIDVEERQVLPEELDTADEIFTSGNYAKIWPATRYESRELEPGPIATRASELYFRWAESTRRQAPT